MNPQLERVLFENYSTLYKYADTETSIDEFDEPPEISQNGIECDDGWITIITQLSETLESLNTANSDTQIHAVQVKEKFGGLRFYTNRHPKPVKTAIGLAQRLSTRTCECCGTTNGAQIHNKNGWRKTLCEACALDWKEIDTQVEIWRFSMKCHQCETETPVVYPRGLGGNHGGTWDTVGPILADKPYCAIKKVHSGVQNQLVWGNTCRACDAYQGNYYVYEAAMQNVEQADGWYPLADFDCIDIIQRTS